MKMGGNSLPRWLGLLFSGALLAFSPLVASGQLGVPGFVTNAPLTTPEDTPLTTQLATVIVCTNLSTATTTVAIVVFPAHGTLSGLTFLTNNTGGPLVTYTPNTNYNGPDLFSWVVSLSGCVTTTYTQPINVTPLNDKPTAQDLSVIVPANIATAIHLAGSDADGSNLTFQVSFPPGHGTLSGTPPNLTYTPQTNYVGADSFTYFSYDGITNSEAATVRIAVKNGVMINSATLVEGNSGTTNAVFTVSLTAPPTETITVNFRTVNVTAVAGSDYMPTNGTLVFTLLSPQQRTIRVPVIGDRLFEANEEFALVLAASANVVVVNGAGKGIILNDDLSVGTGALAPDLAAVKIHERLNYSLTWTHPQQWRLLNTIDLLIADDDGAVLAIRWKEPENTFTLFDPENGKFTHSGVAGSRKHFETPEAVFYLDDSGSVGSGPSGQSVTINYSLSFKPKAAGRTYNVEAFVTDDLGNEQGFDEVGALTVTKK
jgi:hypothetical protein